MVRIHIRRALKYLDIVIPVLFIGMMILIIIWPAGFTHFPISQMHAKHRLEAPSSTFWFGTDKYGRDNYSRVLVGARVSYAVATGAITIAVVIGILAGIVGSISQVFGMLVMRITDVLLCFPTIIIAILFLSLLQASILTLIVVIGVLYAPRIARTVYSVALGIKQQDYIAAERAIGASIFRIVRKGFLPQLQAAVVVQATVYFARAMLVEAGLSFLGLGVPPPTPTWGNMLSDARLEMHISVYPLLFAGLVFTLNIIAINILGDGLRDYFDPKVKRL